MILIFDSDALSVIYVIGNNCAKNELPLSNKIIKDEFRLLAVLQIVGKFELDL